MMPAGAEPESVFVAARFGWNLVMLRGRLREGPPAATSAPAHRTDFALPLGVERSWREQTIQVEAIVRGLAAEPALAIDFPLSDLSYQGHGAKGTATGHLEDLAKAVAAAWESGVTADSEAAWRSVASFLASWDAKIQDHLAHRALVSAAYQLGRGLADIRWAAVLGAGGADDMTSLWYLAGPARVTALKRVLERLATAYDPVTRRAITASLDGWGAVAASGTAVDGALLEQLDLQALVWHDLAVGERVGHDLVDLGGTLERPALLWHAAGQLWPELFLGSLATVALSVGAWCLASTSAQMHPPAAVVTVLGIAGVSVSAISARARSAAKGLGAAIRERVFANLVAERAFIGPGAKQ